MTASLLFCLLTVLTPPVVAAPTLRTRPNFTTANASIAPGSIINRIQSVATSKVLDIPGNSLEDGAVIEQSAWWAGPGQQWNLVRVVNDPRYFQVVSKLSGKCLTVPNGPVAAPMRIEQWGWVGADNQKWRLRAVEGGAYELEAKGSGGLVLDVPNGDCQDGLAIQQFPSNGGVNQRWLLLDGTSPIPRKYAELRRAGLDLGRAAAPEDGNPARRVQHYESGSIFWSLTSGAHEVHGAIRDLYRHLNWDASALGLPTSDESDGPEGRVRYNTFQHGSICWYPERGASAYNIGDKFIATQRNDGDNMQHHLKMYRDEFGVDAVVVEPPHVNFPPDLTLSYYNFICHPWWPDDGSDPDGDLDFRVVFLPDTYDPGVWSPDTWVFGDGDNRPDQIKAKLRSAANVARCEIIMYGRTGSCDDGSHFEPTLALLPGWAENPPQAATINGIPIAGNVERGPLEPVRGHVGVPEASTVGAIAGVELKRGTVLHLNGFLALDCHRGECWDGDPLIDNVELHPLYAVEVLSADGTDDSIKLCEAIGGGLPLIDALSVDEPQALGSAVGLAIARADAQRLTEWHAAKDELVNDLINRVENALPKRCR